VEFQTDLLPYCVWALAGIHENPHQHIQITIEFYYDNH